MPLSLSRYLGDFISTLSYENLPLEVIDKVKTCLIHNIGIGLAGYTLNSVQTAIKLATEFGTVKRNGATVLVDGHKVTLQSAAFANGTLIHARGQDDHFHSGIVHPGATVIPAALAIGEFKHCNGKEFLCSIASGYEITTRLSKKHARSSISKGFRSTPLYGVFGAAAAASRLLKLSRARTANALGWAANLAGGLTEGILAHTSEVQYHAGFASANGILAALLASKGAKTAAKSLEGNRGFYNAYIGSTEDLQQIIDGLGDNYEMMATFFKPFPVGGLVQKPVEVMLSLVRKYNLKPDDIKQITISMNPTEVQYPGAYSKKPGPVSIRYCTAVACVHRKVTWLTMSQSGNTDVLNLMEKIAVIPDYDLKPLSCKFSISVKGSTAIYEDANSTTADYCYNLEQEIKLITSMFEEMVLPAEKMLKIIRKIKELEYCEDIGDFIQLSTIN